MDKSDLATLLARAVTLKDDDGVLVEHDKANGLVTFTWDDRWSDDDAKRAAATIARWLQQKGMRLLSQDFSARRTLVLRIPKAEEVDRG
ncbi:hypothetical protein ACIRSS_21730 [Amycolatopsis sp. NPDC101161]|uniref:hypothetical protein n=1 Tax=Amycolatopsis sp. NPDC101161 TaxID=3363940 RepID=UPI0038053D4D